MTSESNSQSHEVHEGHEEWATRTTKITKRLFFFVFFVAQKSICALTFANRAVITDVGVSQRPLGMNAWL